MLELDAVVVGRERPLMPPTSFTVSRGEVVGLAGPNGVGKSTLLAAIAGVTPVFSGHLRRPPTWRLAWLVQNPPRFAAPYTGREILAALGVAENVPPRTLLPLLDHRLDRLSGGEHQLMMLWVTLAQACELVLLDEPTNHLDERHLAIASEEIARMRDQRAILIVSHDADFLSTVCDRVLRLTRPGAQGGL